MRNTLYELQRRPENTRSNWTLDTSLISLTLHVFVGDLTRKNSASYVEVVLGDFLYTLLCPVELAVKELNWQPRVASQNTTYLLWDLV